MKTRKTTTYLLRNIPDDIWIAAHRKAQKEGWPIRHVLIMLLQAWLGKPPRELEDGRSRPRDRRKPLRTGADEDPFPVL